MNVSYIFNNDKFHKMLRIIIYIIIIDKTKF